MRKPSTGILSITVKSPLKNGDNTEGCLPEGWEDYLFEVLKESEFLDFWPIGPDIINVNEMDSQGIHHNVPKSRSFIQVKYITWQF